MATTTNLYDIVDENGEIIHKRKSAKEIEEIYGLKPTMVFKRLHNGWIVKGHKAIQVSGFEPNVEKHDKIGMDIWKEWDEVTSKIKKKIIWVKVPDENTKVIRI